MRIAINGLGRIGGNILKLAIEKGLNIVAVNDITDSRSIAYFLQHDSVYGPYSKKISYDKNSLTIGGKKIKFFSEKNPENLPWKELNIDIVIESTGAFTDREGASKHIRAGAKRVIISAPSNDSDVTIVPGVNDSDLKKNHEIISMGSCTTNCSATVAKIIDDEFKIKKGFMSTIHAYTPSQKLLDNADKQLRRGRAAALNIIPSSTGATISVCQAIPSLLGKIDGLAFRVPVACGSIVDFVIEVKKETNVNEVNKKLKQAANGKYKNILEYSEEELVSSDIIRNSHSAIIDSLLTQVQGNTIKILAWYDNEFGYSCRMIDLLKSMK